MTGTIYVSGLIITALILIGFFIFAKPETLEWLDLDCLVNDKNDPTLVGLIIVLSICWFMFWGFVLVILSLTPLYMLSYYGNKWFYNLREYIQEKRKK